MRRLPIRFPQNHTAPPARLPFTIDLRGDWKSCTATIPKDCGIIGTVTSQGVTGALARLNRTGNYVKIVAGEVCIVNAIKVQQALAALRDRETHNALEMIPVKEFAE